MAVKTFQWRNDLYHQEFYKDNKFLGWKAHVMERGRKLNNVYKSAVQSHLDYIQHKPSQVQEDIAKPESSKQGNKNTSEKEIFFFQIVI